MLINICSERIKRSKCKRLQEGWKKFEQTIVISMDMPLPPEPIL
jgi:hypothetical protein